ncbi:hypothetical protein ACFE04_023097 [Oxalis oulophora]
MATPGEVLGNSSELKPGRGAYVASDDGVVYASLTGRRHTVPPPSDLPDQRHTVEVISYKMGAVPEPGSVVIARVTKVMAKMASADIMCVGTKAVREKFSGTIRQQDVRATEIDKVDMHQSYRPGDIVKAEVLSLGDARAYYLSTAKNELGVVSAESASGGTMVPISWTEMQCPLTGQIEQRKVAKVGGKIVYVPGEGFTQVFVSKLEFFFLTAESDSPKSTEEQPNFQILLQEIAESFDLSLDYFAKLPSDLRLDLNDAAFDLSNGPVIDECGQELGETLLNLSRAWEKADTSTSYSLASKLPELEGSLTDNARSALGKRLVSAGRRFQAMGQYGQGELQKIAKAMIKTGKLLSEIPISAASDEQLKEEVKVFKFGELQIALTPEKANLGAAIGLIFGILSWGLAQGVQGTPESSMQYANENALLLAKSLRGTLLALCYSSAVLSVFTSIGLVLLGRQLELKDE